MDLGEMLLLLYTAFTGKVVTLSVSQMALVFGIEASPYNITFSLILYKA